MDEVLGERPLTKASDALQGAVPGLLVSSGGNGPTSSKSFQIRGAYSLGIQNSDGSYGATVAPLILIDNVEGDIDLVNPDDIESITVLKDAASSAIYGARAAGGVILVTTKRPQGATRFQLNYNNNLAFTNAINLPKQASLDTFLQAYQDTGRDDYWSLGSPSVTRWRELLQQYQQDPSSVPTQGDGIFRDDNGALYYLNEKDLIKNMLETGFQQTHNLSVSGGTERLRFRLSGGFTNNGHLPPPERQLVHLGRHHAVVHAGSHPELCAQQEHQSRIGCRRHLQPPTRFLLPGRQHARRLRRGRR